MLALVDADIVAFRCAASAEKESEDWIARARTKELVEQILHDTGATEYKLFLTGERNFRKDIYPLYKANRTQPKPKWLAMCKDYLIEHWQATVTDGYEADDALGFHQSLCIPPDSTIICSIDKDLMMIPGKHYNFVKKEFAEVNELQAQRTFYTSMLVGDAADNVKGVPGIGKAKAPKILDGCESEVELYEAVRSMYEEQEDFDLNADLLWIWRQPDGRWTLNRGKLLKQEPEVMLESMPLMVEELTPSTALGTTK